MATDLVLRDDRAPRSRGTNDTNKAGSAVAWRTMSALPEHVTSALVGTSSSVTTVTGPTNGVEVGNPALEWVTGPISTAVTVSGTVTFNIYAYESSMNANATVAVIMERLDSTFAVVSTIVDSSFGTELTTSAALKSWTASPTSTTLNPGDSIRVRVYFDDATASTMGSGFTCAVQYESDAASLADSHVQLTETLAFLDYPGPWTIRNSPVEFVSYITYENSTWVICGTDASGNGALATATDPTGTWTSRTVSMTGQPVTYVAYGGGAWVLVGGDTQDIIKTSTDLATWSVPTTNPFTGTLGLSVVATDGTTWCAMGSSSSTTPRYEIATATNPAGTWTLRQSPYNVNESITYVMRYGNGYWVRGGINGDLQVATNPAQTWTVEAALEDIVSDICYADSTWVAVSGGRISTAGSDPTGTWTTRWQHDRVFLGSFYGVTYDQGLWIAITRGGHVVATTSPTGTWNLLPTTRGTHSYRAAKGDGTYWVVAAEYGKIATATSLADTSTVLWTTDTASAVDEGAGVTEHSLSTSRGSG